MSEARRRHVAAESQRLGVTLPPAVTRQDRLLSIIDPDPEAASETLRLWVRAPEHIRTARWSENTPQHMSALAAEYPQEAAAAPTRRRRRSAVTYGLFALCCLLWGYCAARESRCGRWLWRAWHSDPDMDLPAWLVVALLALLMALAGGMEGGKP